VPTFEPEFLLIWWKMATGCERVVFLELAILKNGRDGPAEEGGKDLLKALSPLGNIRG
jgi:hypothetical protein